MNLSFLSCFTPLLIIVPLLLLDKPTQAKDDEEYQTCKKPFLCGGVNITYPFYDGKNRPAYCGYPGFMLSCFNQLQISTPSLGVYYQLVNMNSTSHTVTVERKNYWDGNCPKEVTDGGINLELYRYTSSDENITLYYGCQSPDPTLTWLSNLQFNCAASDANTEAGYFMTQTLLAKFGPIPLGFCLANVSVPVNKSVVGSISDISSLRTALQSSFELEWDADNDDCDNCQGSGGECGWDQRKNQFACYGTTKSNKYTYKIAGVILATSVMGTGIFIVFICYFRRKSSSDNKDDGCMVLQANQDVEAFLRAHGPLPLKRYKYTDLKKVTNSFKEKLGEGGYGTVYKGKLHNGYLVAVKLLKKSKGDAEEFINEVASIGRTNHVNVVTLLGFCIHGQKKALIYDYMPNGSLEKFIYRKDNHQKLAWEKLFQIAVGIARGLEYLHLGCNTRILHFDIKPHNILLDENFCPKISDFGLAKSCKQNDSIISMSGARGTVGFIAPEVYLRGFGSVSYKSDVYSFGMLVLEMVGCRKKATREVELSSDEYFPQWIYKELEQGVEVDHEGILNGDDKTLQKKMILVSLWCIQTNPLSRPTMTRVVEMLEGSIESLQHPPVPSLSSPLMSMPNSSIVDTISLS